MLATLHLLWMFAANRFKSRRRLEAENPFSPASAEYRSETCTARSAAARERSSPVGLDDMALAKLAQLVACGSAGHNPALAPNRVSSLLALEIPWPGWPTEDLPRAARTL